MRKEEQIVLDLMREAQGRGRKRKTKFGAKRKQHKQREEKAKQRASSAAASLGQSLPDLIDSLPEEMILNLLSQSVERNSGSGRMEMYGEALSGFATVLSMSSTRMLMRLSDVESVFYALDPFLHKWKGLRHYVEEHFRSPSGYILWARAGRFLVEDFSTALGLLLFRSVAVFEGNAGKPSFGAMMLSDSHPIEEFESSAKRPPPGFPIDKFVAKGDDLLEVVSFVTTDIYFYYYHNDDIFSMFPFEQEKVSLLDGVFNVHIKNLTVEGDTPVLLLKRVFEAIRKLPGDFRLFMPIGVLQMLANLDPDLPKPIPKLTEMVLYHPENPWNSSEDLWKTYRSQRGLTKEMVNAPLIQSLDGTNIFPRLTHLRVLLHPAKENIRVTIGILPPQVKDVIISHTATQHVEIRDAFEGFRTLRFHEFITRTS